MVLGQNKSIKGTITDAITDEPLIGVAVKIQNSSTGTTTDVTGAFSLQVPESAALVVSYLGYDPQTITVGNTNDFQIKLNPNSRQLEEVVVIGYGTARKKDLTGSVVQILPDKLANENPGTVQDILRGTPGLSIGYDASAKGGGSIQLRGQRSVYDKANHNSPLIVLDGMIFNGELSEINPDDIGQIDILRDASAAAIYGSRAASGVLIITTKKGKQGKPVVNFTANSGATTKSSYREVFGAEDYMKYREDWFAKDTYGVNATTGKYEAYQTAALLSKPGYYASPDNLAKYGITIDQWRAYSANATGETDASIYGKRLGLNQTPGVLENYLAGNTYDWYDHTFRTGLNQDYNTSVSGANDKMNYYMSVGYLRNEGAIARNDYKAIRSNLKLDGKVNNWLEIGANVNFQDRSEGDRQPNLKTDYWEPNQLRNSPYSQYANADGSLVQFPMDAPLKRGFNADFDDQYVDLDKGYTVLNTILNAKVKLPFNITYSFNASPRLQWFDNRYFMSAALPQSDPKTRGVDREWSKNFDWTINNILNWEQTFAQKHHVSMTLIQEAEEHRYWRDRTEARNIQPSDALGFHNTQNGTKENNSITTTDTHQTADALAARAFYSYDDRYMLTASIRRDGYSAFGQSNPYAVFPSLALGWSFTNESFFKWHNIMSSGKLRVSYGENGNRALEDPYVSLANLKGPDNGATMGYITSGVMEEVKYLYVDRMTNPFLQWEKTAALNLGLDFGFLNDRISGTLEYYSMKTHDMIMWERLPGFTGFQNIITNLGEVQNRGFDLGLSTQNIKKKNFSWNTSLSFSYNKNEIKHLYYQNEDIKDANGNVIGTKEMDDKSSRDGKGWFIGQPISAIWNYRVTGIWQVDEVEEAKRYGQKPGDPKVANNPANDTKNADGTTTIVYDDRDKEILGQEAPPVNWQLRNDFTFYKNWSLGFNIYSYMGHKSLSGNYLNNDNGGSLITYGFNTFSKEYWTPENPTNEYARLDAAAPAGAGANKLYDRSFIRLENVTFGYTLPKIFTNKWDVQRVKLYGSVRNVAVWQKDWEYGDPETGGLANRVFSLGLNVTF